MLTGDGVLEVTADGPVRVVTLNRPEKRNAVNYSMHHALAGLWRQMQHDPDARAVVLTGAGSAFCAGVDSASLGTDLADPVRRAAMMDDGRFLAADMLAFPLPVVAAVNGPAAGVGCSLALWCDIVVMAEDAWLADSHVAAAGVAAGDGGAVLWPMLTGLSRAKEYLFTGDRIPAAEAVRLGLANRAVPRSELLGEVHALARRLAALPPFAVRATKQAVNMHLHRMMLGTFEYAIAAEARGFDAASSIR